MQMDQAGLQLQQIEFATESQRQRQRQQQKVNDDTSTESWCAGSGGGVVCVEVAATLCEIGAVQFAKGDFDRAHRYLLQAVHVYEQLYGPGQSVDLHCFGLCM